MTLTCNKLAVGAQVGTAKLTVLRMKEPSVLEPSPLPSCASEPPPPDFPRVGWCQAATCGRECYSFNPAAMLPRVGIACNRHVCEQEGGGQGIARKTHAPP